MLVVKVPSLGAVVQYVDGQAEPHEGIIVKHIDDKCDSILVDRKSHSRRLVGTTLHDTADNTPLLHCNIT